MAVVVFLHHLQLFVEDKKSYAACSIEVVAVGRHCQATATGFLVPFIQRQWHQTRADGIDGEEPMFVVGNDVFVGEILDVHDDGALNLLWREMTDKISLFIDQIYSVSCANDCLLAMP